MTKIQIVDFKFEEVKIDTGCDIAQVVNYIIRNKLNVKYPWLSSVDLNGKTIINTLQKDYFVSELNTFLSNKELEQNVNIEIQNIIKFLNNMKDLEFMLINGNL